MPDLTFLQREDLTTKDKLVVLTSVVHDGSPSVVAGLLNLSVASVKQSLAKAERLDAEAERTQSDDVREALLEVCGMDRASMRPADWKLIAKVTSALVEAGATGSEVRRRSVNLRRQMNLPVTPGSLDKYWAMLAGAGFGSPREVLR